MSILELTATNTIDPKSLFPNEVDQLIDASVTALLQISELTGHHLAQDMVKWNTIKDMLLQEVNPQSNGSVCWLQLSGAQVPGHTTEVGHSIGFITMKDPTPYKYIVYDYNLGAMGFSNEEQLKAFFVKIFEEEGGYFPYTQCVMHHAATVGDECKEFINGQGAGIKPLEQAQDGATCERHFWTKQRLLDLIHYTKVLSSDERALILNRVELLKKPEAKTEVYKAFFTHVTAEHTTTDEPEPELLEKKCQALIVAINNAAIDTNDTDVSTYCEGMSQAIKANKGNSFELTVLLFQLKKVDKAVNSAEMKAIKKQIEQLKSTSKRLFGYGSQKKIEAIKKALYNVSLLDRGNVFSNQTNPYCNQVRIELARHRYAFHANPIQGDGSVSEELAASSFKTVAQDLKKR
jgi:hypothetical protein